MSLLAKNTPSRSEMTKVQQQVKVNGASMTVLRREMQEIRVKQLEQQKQLQDQEQKLLEQSQVIGEQNARLAELEHKLRELLDSNAAVIGGSRPPTAVPSTSSSSAASSTVASTSPATLTGDSLAVASPKELEGEGSSSLKRSRKSSDLPRHSKRLRSRKWGRVLLIFLVGFYLWLITHSRSIIALQRASGASHHDASTSCLLDLMNVNANLDAISSNAEASIDRVNIWLSLKGLFNLAVVFYPCQQTPGKHPKYALKHTSAYKFSSSRV